MSNFRLIQKRLRYGYSSSKIKDLEGSRYLTFAEREKQEWHQMRSRWPPSINSWMIVGPRPFVENMPPSSLPLLHLLLIALALAQDSSPATFLKIATTSEKLHDLKSKIEDETHSLRKDEQLARVDEVDQSIIGRRKRSIPGDAIMRALRSSNAMPRTIRLGVQQGAMLR